MIQLARSKLAGEKPVCIGIPDPDSCSVASVTKAVEEVEEVLVPPLRFSNVTQAGYYCTSSSSQTSQSRPSQSVNLPFHLHSAHWHQLDNLGTALTMIYAILTDPSCEEGLIRNSSNSHPRIRFGVSERHDNTNPYQRNQMAWKTFVPYCPSPFFSSTSNDAPFLVLTDGAHNPASAKSLGDYITHLLYRTYILFLSRPPLIIPLQTLSSMSPLGIPTSNIEFGHIALSMTRHATD